MKTSMSSVECAALQSSIGGAYKYVCVCVLIQYITLKIIFQQHAQL